MCEEAGNGETGKKSPFDPTGSGKDPDRDEKDKIINREEKHTQHKFDSTVKLGILEFFTQQEWQSVWDDIEDESADKQRQGYKHED